MFTIRLLDSIAVSYRCPSFHTGKKAPSMEWITITPFRVYVWWMLTNNDNLKFRLGYSQREI